MRNSLRFKIIATVMVVMFLAVSTLIYNTYTKLKTDIITNNEEAFGTFYHIFTSEKELEINKYSMALDALLDNPHVTIAFAARDKKSLAALTDRIYKTKLKPLYGIEQFQFHIPPATSFYRVHMPAKSGDDLSAFRKTVVKANRYKSMVAGIETGRGGLGLRVVKPVWNNFDYAGTVEFGGNIDNMLRSAKESTGIDYAIGIKQSNLSRARFAMNKQGWLKHGNMMIYNFSDETITRIIKNDVAKTPDHIFRYKGKFYITSVMSIYDFSSAQIGSIFLLKDITTEMAAMHNELIKQGVITVLFGILSVFVISLVLFRMIFQPLRRITNHIKANEITVDSEPKLIETHGDKSEISNLARTFNTMSQHMHKYLLQIKDQMELINASNQTLEDNVKERTQELELANAKLNKALENYKSVNEAKSEFLADMSHEIRSPMNSVLGLSYLAMQTGLSEKQYEYVNKINKSASLVLEIINDILDFSKIEAGKLELENVCFSLPETISAVKDILEIQAEKKNIIFTLHMADNLPGYIKGDPLRLTQVLNNLGANAVKFTDKGTVDMYVDIIDSNMSYTTLKFTVKDTGIGIQHDRIGNLFESYVQASSDTSRKYGGSGLGLSITKKILDKMGGSIFVESQPGKGSTFWFTLHMKNADITNTEEFAEKGKQLKGKRILVAEKYYSDPGSISAIYRQLMADVVSVDTRIDLLKVLSSNVSKNNRLGFDLIILESLMDCESPIAGVESLSQSVEGLVLPNIISFSGKSQNDEINGLITSLEKPVSAATLLRTTSTILNITGDLETSDAIIKGARCRFLVADDNSLSREVAGGLLSMLGVECSYASNGYDAVRKAEKEVFDIILLDDKMPDMTGVNTAKIIRQTDKCSKSDIYIMSAKNHAEQDAEPFDININGHVSKPLSIPDLSVIISKSKKDETSGERILSERSEGHIDTDKGLLNFGGNTELYKKALTDMLEYIDSVSGSLTEKTDLAPHGEVVQRVRDFAENLAMPKLMMLSETVLKNSASDDATYCDASIILFTEELANIRDILSKELQ